MNRVLVALLVPVLSILVALALLARAQPSVNLLTAALIVTVLVGLGHLFIGLPLRRWCRRQGRNHVGWWLLQWMLVLLPPAFILLLTALSQLALVAALSLPVVGALVALTGWCLTDCRPLPPP